MMRLVVILGCMLAACSAAIGQSKVSLQPLARQDLASPLRKARLTVQSDLGQTVRAIKLHWTGGGPAVLVEAAIEPRGRTDLTVELPAISSEQVYQVSLLPRVRPDVTPLEVVNAPITWSLEMVNTDVFLYYRYDQAQPRQPSLPGHFKLNLLLVLVLVSVALGAVLLVGRGWVRIVLLVVVLAAGSLAVAAMNRRVEPVEVSEVYLPRLPVAGRLLAVGARKSTLWQSPRLLVPAYQSSRQMEQDSSVIIDARSIVVPLKAGQVRLLLEPQQNTNIEH